MDLSLLLYYLRNSLLIVYCRNSLLIVIYLRNFKFYPNPVLGTGWLSRLLPGGECSACLWIQDEIPSSLEGFGCLPFFSDYFFFL